MTEKQDETCGGCMACIARKQETCENCGELEDRHPIIMIVGAKHIGCKKFKAKKGLGKKPKGCGKEACGVLTRDRYGDEDIDITPCGCMCPYHKVIEYCKDCKPQEETCENCGRIEKEHIVDITKPETLGDKCKKFVAKEKTYNEVAHDVLEGELTKMTEKQEETCEDCGHVEVNRCSLCGGKKFVAKTSLGKKPKGCGKEAGMTVDRYGEHDVALCGEEVIERKTGKRVVLWCPDCKPKNHSQGLLPVQRETDVLGKRLKPADTSSENSTSLKRKNSISTPVAEGTFNLSKKRTNVMKKKIGCGKYIEDEKFGDFHFFSCEGFFSLFINSSKDITFPSSMLLILLISNSFVSSLSSNLFSSSSKSSRYSVTHKGLSQVILAFSFFLLIGGIMQQSL